MKREFIKVFKFSIKEIKNGVLYKKNFHGQD